MREVEIYSKFYDGMDARSKDLVNSSSGGSFYKLRLSKAKDVLGRLLSAKREYEDTKVTPAQEKVKNTPTRDKEILLESRVDKLEEILQLVIQTGQQPSTPVQTHFQNDQVNHHQSSREVGNMITTWDPECQEEVYQQEHPCGGEWNWAEDHQDFQPYTEPCPTPTQISSWPMGYPADQPYPEHRNPELYHSACQPDYSSHDLFCSNHPYQTCSPETGDYCPTWSNEDLQIQNTPYYTDQACPNQPQHQPHQQLSFEPTSEEDHHANSAEEEIEGATALQQKVQGCTRSEAEMIMEMHRAYEEQQSNMDHMIKQVALLSVMMKEMQENRAEPERYGEKEEEKGTSEAETENLSSAARKSEALLGEAEISEEEPVRGETQEKVQAPDERVEEPMNTAVDKEYMTAEWPPRRTKIPREEWPRMAWSIYWLKMEPWPESHKEEKLSLLEWRPKEKKKILGSYRHHRKKPVFLDADHRW